MSKPRKHVFRTIVLNTMAIVAAIGLLAAPIKHIIDDPQVAIPIGLGVALVFVAGCLMHWHAKRRNS